MSFAAPFHYNQLSPEEQQAKAVLTSDYCAIADEDYFVRGTLEIPVAGADEPFIWGVWVSLSRTNFERYLATLETPGADEGPYFGWLSSRLPGYPDTLLMKTHVFFRAGNLRPRIDVEPTDHPLAIDQRNGISPADLRRIVEANHHPQQ